MRIYSAEETKKFCKPFKDGVSFTYYKTDYMTTEADAYPSKEFTQQVISDLNNRYPINLPIDVFIMPGRLRFYGKSWGDSYEGRAYPTHILIGARYEYNEADFANTITHELGHSIYYKYIQGTEKWKEYLTLRGLWEYVEKELTNGYIMWEDRTREIFAEDFRLLFGSNLAKQNPSRMFDGENLPDPKPPDESIRKWFLSLVEEMIKTRTFKSYTTDTIKPFIDGFLFSRPITAIHIHHTWKPSKLSYKGEETILAMWRYHTETNGWRDIGQHFSVAPDGAIWDGRDLNDDPASIKNFNKGAISIEIIGNFDMEYLEGAQREAVIQLVLALLDKTSLSTDDIIFHREYSQKTCPGTHIDKTEFIAMVNSWRKLNKPKSLIGTRIDDQAEVYLNGRFIGIAPIINGVSYFPTRAGSEKIGFKVEWKPGRIDIKE